MATNGSGDKAECGPPPPIAIIGMGMRLPGGITNAPDFWNFLKEGKDGHCRVPESRYNIHSHYSSHKPNTVKTEYGYFLQEDPAYFDAKFFNLVNRQADILDPQQRLLQEVVWECLENSGHVDFDGKDVGCFVGVFGNDWLELGMKDSLDLQRHYTMGSQDYIFANRLSQVFDFMGPSVTYKTACSSSIIALHDACQALYSGDCSAAIVAGTSLQLDPYMTTSLSDHKALSPSGLCKTFDADADGYGRGEAVNAIIIKKLDDALRDGDAVRAVIRATASNSDGKQEAAGVPKMYGQEQVIRRAYKKAGISDFSQTAFVECHGTGTAKGDPTEAGAVARVFKDGVFIGAVKPNVGHSEGSSGLTSIIKAVLSLEHKTILPNIHFQTPNPNIPFETAKLCVPLEPTSWPEGCADRISVNNMGAGGSNAHVILDSAASFSAARPTLNGTTVPSRPRLLAISARGTEALRKRVKGVQDYIKHHPDSLSDVAYTLGSRRKHFANRTFIISGGPSPVIATDLPPSQKEPFSAVTFAFTGQGAQWAGMGRKMMAHFESFRKDMKLLDIVLQRLKPPPSWTIEEELSRSKGSKVDEAEFAQPLCTAIQICLVNLLSSWGIKPDSVVGHSSGEIAAAYAAGAIPVTTAITLSYHRGQVMKLHRKPGAMAAVSLGKDDALPFLNSHVQVACVNSPRGITISGEPEALDRVLAEISSEHPEVLCRRLQVDTAYHTTFMEEAAVEYKKLTESHILRNSSMIPMYSSITGRIIVSPAELDAAYWSQTITKPVCFYSAVKTIIDNTRENRVFVGIGPHSALAAPLREIFDEYSGESRLEHDPTLSRHEDEVTSILSTMGKLFMRSIPFDMSAINGHGKLLTDLPTYPWQHDRIYWYETRMAREWRNRMFPSHELLGSRTLESTDSEPSWRNRLQVENASWLMDHNVDGDIIFPCAGYISMVGEAIRQVTGEGEYSIRELFIRTALALPEDTSTEILTSFKPATLTGSLDSSWYEFTVSAYYGKKWHKHCVGQVHGGKQTTLEAATDIQPLPRHIDSELWYETMEDRGLNFGPQFRRLENLTANPVDYEAVADTNTDQSMREEYGVHPVMMDQGFQLLGVASCNGLSRRLPKIGVPVAIDAIYVGQATLKTLLKARFKRTGSGGAVDTASGGNVFGVSDGGLAFRMEGVKFFPLQHDSSSKLGTVPLASRTEWKPDIDLLPAKDIVVQTIPKTDSIIIVAKMLLLGITQFNEVLQPTSLPPSMLVIYQAWVKTNGSRIVDVLKSFLPEAENWYQDPEALRLQFIKDIGVAAKAPKADTKSVSSFLPMFLDMMDGRLAPLEYLFDNNGFPSMYEYFATLIDMGHTFSLLGHSNPTMRILEISSNTCGTTAAILSCLHSPEGVSMYSHYTVAARTTERLEEAKERFNSIDGVESVLIDIGKSLVDQGLDEASYDLVIAPNDLPNEVDISSALRNIRTLLVPGGRFLIRDVIPPVPFVDYLLSFLPASSAFTTKQSQDVPYPTDFWDKEIPAAGFTDPDPSYCTTYAYPWSTKHNILSRNPYPELPKAEISVLCNDRTHQWVQTLERRLRKDGYTVHWYNSLDTLPPDDGQDVISLLDLEEPFLKNISKDDYNALIQYLSQTRRTLWMTKASQMACQDASSGLILGLSRTTRHEAMLDFGTLEIEELDFSAISWLIKVYEKFRRQPMIGKGSPECEFVLHKGVVHVPRFHWLPLDEVSRSPAGADAVTTLTVSGGSTALDTVAWRHTAAHHPIGRDEVEIDVHYVGLNFRDIMVSVGVISDGQGLGVEASGVISQVGADVKHLKLGDKVTTMGSGLFSTRIVVLGAHCFPFTDKVTMAEAATMPVAHGTAVYALMDIGRLQRGQSVLVQSACGAVGQAAIQICQEIGAEVFATVGTEQKAQYLVDNFGIPRQNISHSRDKSFVADVLRETKGRGVDIVLNSLAGELLHESWKCVAPFGAMIELGKRDFLGNGMLKMQPFGSNRSFFGVDILALTREAPGRFQKLWGNLVKLYRQEKIHPIQPIKKFNRSQVHEAFAYMQRGTHLGKILIDMKSDATTLAISPAVSGTTFSADAAYLLVGGFGGLGRAISNWMVENGARHLVFLSRSGAQSPSNQAFLKELEAQGCKATAVMGSATNPDDIQHAIDGSIKPVAGVVHLGMVLKSEALLRTTHEDWLAVQEPKVEGAWNLHKAFESTPLDFFVLASSIASLCGMVGQVSYAAANSYLDAMAKYRRSQGLAGSVLNLGAVGDIGCFRQMPELLAMARATGVRFMDESEVLESVQAAINISKPSDDKTSQDDLYQIIAGMSTTAPTAGSSSRSAWSQDARFRLYANMAPTARDPESANVADGLNQLLAMARQAPAKLKEKAAEELVLKLIAQKVTGQTSDGPGLLHFANMAIDSMIVIEVGSWIRRHLALDIRPASLAGAGTLGELSRMILEVLQLEYSTQLRKEPSL